MAGALLTLLARPAAASATRVVITIDVESNAVYTLPAQRDATCEDGSGCGLTEIVRMLNARGLAGTFFLNVYEHTRWGQTAMRDIAVALQQAGQDVALHTHPDAVDPKRPEMYQYDLAEQTAIIRDGVQLLSAWTGRPVVAHRAGAYSADERTLDALERNDVLVDSSMFWSQPKSHLDALGRPRNLPWHHGRVLELPITVYERQDRPALLAMGLAPVSSIRKIDVDWVINAQEARDAIDQVVAAQIPVLIVFLHSFSFLADEHGRGPLQADRLSIDLFRAMLDHVAAKSLPVVTMRQIAQEGLPSIEASRPDTVPQVHVAVDYPHYVWRRFKAAGERASVAISISTVLFVSGCAVFVVRRYRRR
jgi:peptidoglycan/xylan/chitin deacetylase (PgdA/CDA1 family)